MGLMAMSASLIGASCAKSCDVEWSWVRFGNRAGGRSNAVNFSTLRPHREVQNYSCYSFSSCTKDLESWGLKSSRCGRFSRRSKLDTTLRWRYGATNSHSRWRRGVTARCGSAESAGEGRKTSAAVLDVYLIQELLPPLVLGTVAFTVLGVSIGVGPEVMALVERLGFSFRYWLLYAQIVFLRLPTYIGLALPMASLLASMLAFGRLGVDSEITALRAAGIGSSRMLRPTFILFMGITALHLLLAELLHRV